MDPVTVQTKDEIGGVVCMPMHAVIGDTLPGFGDGVVFRELYSTGNKSGHSSKPI